MRNGAVASLLVVAILAGAGAGYYIGTSNVTRSNETPQPLVLGEHGLEFVQESNCPYGSWLVPWAVMLNSHTVGIQPSSATLPLSYAGAHLTSDSNYSTIWFGVPNGTYDYTILPKNIWGEEQNGTVTVNGGSMVVHISAFITPFGCSTTSTTSPVLLPVYEENCTIVYFSPSEPNGGTICSVPNGPVVMPNSFNLSSISSGGGINQGTLQDVFFGVYLESGQAVSVSMNSTSPIILRTYLDNRTGYDVKALANEAANYGHLLTNQTEVTTYGVRFFAQQSGLYIYELTVNQPNPIPHVNFDIRTNDLPP